MEKGNLKIEWISPEKLKGYPKNSKIHDAKQIANVANSIRRFGWQQPLVIDDAGVVVIGHCRLLAAKKLGLKTVPVTVASGLTEDEIRELRIADNKTNESPWDFELLQEDLEGLEFEGFDFDFEIPGEEEEPAEVTEDNWDKPLPEEPRSKLGDIWQLGRHRLMCGDSTVADNVEKLMRTVKANAVITDPPYGTTNCSWDANGMIHICDYVNKVTTINAAICVFSQQPYTTELIANNLNQFKYDIIWNKSHPTGFLNAKKAPMRAHETICVFYESQPTYNPIMSEVVTDDIGRKKKNGTKAEQYNEYETGTYIWEETGKRYPTDVISFSSWNGARFGDTKNATMHPTQKPVELLAYLIKTYSNENDSVLDIFGGSGSTLIACEQTGRNCYMMELDPRYVDVIIDRWETFTGGKAVLLNG